MNRIIIQNEILKKNTNYPYRTTVNDIKSVVTDHDVFPYTRYWRGDYRSDVPIVSDREAGYRKVKKCTTSYDAIDITDTVGDACFQYPCNTVYPCNEQQRCVTLYR
jgi:hypothetical protein